MAITFDCVENAASGIKKYFSRNPSVIVEATYAPGNPSDYHRYIVLTQRMLFKGEVICYITYRYTRTTPTKSPNFSSYEILDSSYVKSLTKLHLRDYPNPTECIQAVIRYLEGLING